MDYKEAYDAMIDGKKIRCCLWEKDKRMFFDDDGNIAIAPKAPKKLLEDFSIKKTELCDQWEIWETPTLYTIQDALEEIKKREGADDYTSFRLGRLDCGDKFDSSYFEKIDWIIEEVGSEW